MHGTTSNFAKNTYPEQVRLSIRSSPIWSDPKAVQWQPPMVQLELHQLDSGRCYNVWMSVDEAKAVAAEILKMAETATKNGSRPEPMF